MYIPVDVSLYVLGGGEKCTILLRYFLGRKKHGGKNTNLCVIIFLAEEEKGIFVGFSDEAEQIITSRLSTGE